MKVWWSTMAHSRTWLATIVRTCHCKTTVLTEKYSTGKGVVVFFGGGYIMPHQNVETYGAKLKQSIDACVEQVAQWDFLKSMYVMNENTSGMAWSLHKK